jgi:DNA repair photolyase
MSKNWQKVNIKTQNGDFEGKAPVIISASRATDIPAFYFEWFMNRVDKGYIKWMNKFSNKAMYVSLEKMRAVVFWTDYETEKLEPHVPPMQSRIETFKRLSDTIGKEKVIWRFDPLILADNLTIDRLLDKIYGIGREIHDHTEKLVVSFIDIALYGKVKRNLIDAGFTNYREFYIEDMTRIAQGLQEMNREWKLEVATCAEATDLLNYGINHNKCVDDALMIRLFSHDRELMDFLGYVVTEESLLPQERKRTKALKDKGQRKHCGCVPSKDIGQHDTCIHGCLYCYANASPLVAQSNYEKHKEKDEYGDTII